MQAKIERIKIKLMEIGDMRPGSLSKQYNVCGNPTCRCKDPEKPKRHGPYHQLSYTHRGKHTTEFVKKENLAAVKSQLKNYAKFRKLTDEWVDLAIQSAKMRKGNPKQDG